MEERIKLPVFGKLPTTETPKQHCAENVRRWSWHDRNPGYTVRLPLTSLCTSCSAFPHHHSRTGASVYRQSHTQHLRSNLIENTGSFLFIFRICIKLEVSGNKQCSLAEREGSIIKRGVKETTIWLLPLVLHRFPLSHDDGKPQLPNMSASAYSVVYRDKLISTATRQQTSSHSCDPQIWGPDCQVRETV